MSRPSYNVQSVYTGTGAVSSYTFTFKITRPEQLLIIILDPAGMELKRFRGDDNVELQTLSFDRFNGGGTVILPAALAAGRQIGLFLDDASPIQNYEFKNKSSFTLQRIEDALDNLGAGIQTLMRRMQQTLHFGEFDDPDATTFPSLTGGEGRVLAVDEDGKMALGPLLDDIGGGISPDGTAAEADYVTFDDQLEPIFESGIFSGFSARYNTALDLKGIREALLYVFNFQYLGPLVSLSASGNGTLREKGTPVTASTLGANVTKRSNDIARIKFFKDGVLLTDMLPPAIIGSGNTQYNWTGSFSDTATFSTEVTDVAGNGGPTTSSSSATFSFVYPYYWTNSTPGKTAAQVAVLGGAKKVIGNTNNQSVTFNVNVGDIVYFAYPAAYGALSSIKDQNNFEAIGGFTATTENITGLDGTVQSYRLYKLSNTIGVAGTTTYTFLK